MVRNPVVLVMGDQITAAGADVAVPAGARVIDLGGAMLLPGLIDAHTHLLQNYDGAYGGDDPNMVLTVATMSPAKRALLGVKMGQEDLEAGFTTVRDLGNSGWGGDVALRDAMRSAPDGSLDHESSHRREPWPPLVANSAPCSPPCNSSSSRSTLW